MHYTFTTEEVKARTAAAPILSKEITAEMGDSGDLGTGRVTANFVDREREQGEWGRTHYRRGLIIAGEGTLLITRFSAISNP